VNTTAREVSASALATRARDAAAKADAAAWALQVRAWPQPSDDYRMLTALHQTAAYLRIAADALDRPNVVTYMAPVHLRSNFAGGGAVLVGAAVVALTMSGPAMAIVVAAYVTLVMALLTVYPRWAIRQGPRRVESDDSSPLVAELTAEITSLLEALQPESGPTHAKAQTPLQAAAGWIQIAGATPSDPGPLNGSDAVP
jgi:hypothetical protein